MSDDAAAKKDEEGKIEVDRAISDLKAHGRVVQPGEVGNRAIRVLKPGDLKEMVLELLKKYGGLGQAELIQKIQELEVQCGKERERGAADAAARIEELEKAVGMERGRSADFEARLAAAIAEIDRLAAEKAALERALTTSDLRTRAELEKIVVELQQRILELEIALDYFDLEEEPDPARSERLVHAAQQSAGSASSGLKDRVSQLSASSKKAHETFSLLREKMHDGKATVGVVVDLVKAIKDASSGEEQAQRISECFEGRS